MSEERLTPAAAKKKMLDEGGKLEDKERDFWAQSPEHQSRLMAVLPTMVHEALGQLSEKHGQDISPDILHFLNVSASKALMSLPHPHATAQVIQKDAATFLRQTKADDGRQAALAVCYLILQLVDEDKIPQPNEMQAVMAATVIMEEAKDDGPTRGWRMDQNKVAQGAASIRERLEAHGYLRLLN